MLVEAINVCRGSIGSAFAGALCGGAASFMMGRTMWQRASEQGAAVDAQSAQLRKLRGAPPAPPPPPELPLGLFELRLRNLFATKWNEQVMGAYAVAKKFV